ncbi:MAG: recombination protein O N-terminal domain-containing protein [Candidatus Kaiserbacteria bacterium]|nr:recombination protein O N-terminal domain-containing protein [Candidatus Kaiserbacteria bacterium]
MRHKYETRGIVLSRTPAGEMNAIVTVLTQDIGLVRARAQGVRRPGAKLAHALTTFSESELILVRGKENWRVAGAVLKENWFLRIRNTAPRERAARVSGLLLRLVAGETNDSDLFLIMRGFFESLATLHEDTHEAVEILAVLRFLAVLGLDAEEISRKVSLFAPEMLADITKNRTKYITRINRGIEASGL